MVSDTILCGSGMYRTPPMEGHWKFFGGSGTKRQTLEERYEAKLAFPGG